MRVAILGGPSSPHVKSLLGAFEVRGIRAEVCPVAGILSRAGNWGGDAALLDAAGTALEAFDAVVVRSVPAGSLEQVIFRLDVLHRLERLGVPVINPPGAIEKAVDKFYASFLLHDHDIPTPRTVVAQRYNEAMEVFSLLGDVVVKPLFGSLGKGIVRVTDEEVAHRVFRALELSRYVFYIQEFIPHNNEDIRAFVVGDRILASMRRRAGSWKTNIACGASAAPLQLPAELEDLCLRVARIIGAEYLGIDILKSEGGDYYVIEANSIPGWEGLQGATGIDVGGALAEHVISRARGAAPPPILSPSAIPGSTSTRT